MCFNAFYQTPNSTPDSWQDLKISDEVKKLKGSIGYHAYHQSDNPMTRKMHVNDYTALWSSIDPVRFYKKDHSNNTFKSYIEDPNNNVSEPLTGWHPSPQGHKAWANELVRYIKENKLY
jgi:hypothetical protein